MQFSFRNPTHPSVCMCTILKSTNILRCTSKVLYDFEDREKNGPAYSPKKKITWRACLPGCPPVRRRATRSWLRQMGPALPPGRHTCSHLLPQRILKIHLFWDGETRDENGWSESHPDLFSILFVHFHIYIKICECDGMQEREFCRPFFARSCFQLGWTRMYPFFHPVLNSRKICLTIRCPRATLIHLLIINYVY